MFVRKSIKFVIKINKWDSSAVKNALDDAVKFIFIQKYNCIEDFSLLNGKLFLCGISVTIAIIALLYDYLYPFPASKPALIACVSFYFLLIGFLTLYTTYKEKDIFMIAIQRDPAGLNPDIIWEASSYLEKYDDKYTLKFSIMRTPKRFCVTGSSWIQSIANFIDVNGVVIPEFIEPFVTRLAEIVTLQQSFPELYRRTTTLQYKTQYTFQQISQKDRIITLEDLRQGDLNVPKILLD